MKALWFCILSVAITIPASAAKIYVAGDLRGEPGEEIELRIEIDDGTGISDIQFDLEHEPIFYSGPHGQEYDLFIDWNRTEELKKVFVLYNIPIVNYKSYRGLMTSLNKKKTLSPGKHILFYTKTRVKKSAKEGVYKFKFSGVLSSGDIECVDTTFIVGNPATPTPTVTPTPKPKATPTPQPKKEKSGISVSEWEMY